MLSPDHHSSSTRSRVMGGLSLCSVCVRARTRAPRVLLVGEK